MGGVAKAVKGMFKGPDTSATEAALAKQNAALAKQEANVKAVEDGQRRAQSSNRGLLAFIDDELKKVMG